MCFWAAHSCKSRIMVAGGVTQYLRALPTLSEDQSLIPSTRMQQVTTRNSSSRGSEALSDLCRHPQTHLTFTHRHTHKDTEIIKEHSKNKEWVVMIYYLDSKLRSENKPSSVHPLLTALRYTMPKRQKQTKCSSRNQQKSKVQCIHRKT